MCTVAINTAPFCRSGPSDDNQTHLIVPYTLGTNEVRFASPQGFNIGEKFFTYLKDSFHVLYTERKRLPKMLSIGMHYRLLGRFGKFRAWIYPQ